MLVDSPDLRLAADTCERLRLSVAQHDWRSIVPGAPVTISIGVTVARAGDDRASLMRRADTAMYRAKGEGRNRVVRAEALDDGVSR